MSETKQSFTVCDDANPFLDGHYVLQEDSSLMPSNLLCGSFQLLLGAGYHTSIGINAKTGECLTFYGLLDAIDFESAVLKIPESRKCSLFFKCASLKAQEGDHYIPFVEKAYFDEKQSVLSFGDITADTGQVFEFAKDTYVKLLGDRLLCVYIRVPQNAIERIKQKPKRRKRV